MEIYNFNINNNPYEVKIVSIKGTIAVVDVNGAEFSVDISDIGDLHIHVSSPAVKTRQAAASTVSTVSTAAPAQTISKAPVSTGGTGNDIVSPMPGQVIKIIVSAGDAVKAGDIVVTIEAMKMENQIRATKDGTVSKILVKEGDVVSEGTPLVSLGS